MLKFSFVARRIAASLSIASISVLALGASGASAVPAVDTTSHISVGVNPWGMAVTSDGQKAYVANNGDGTVSVVDLTTNTVTSTIPFGTGGPYGVAISPNGAEVWVTRPGSGSIGVIDTSTDQFASLVTGYGTPLYVVFDHAGTYAWVTDNTANAVIKTDTTSGNAAATITTGIGPEGEVLSPDGSKLYVAASDGSITVIDTATNAHTTYLGIAPWPQQLAISNDGRFVFATDNTGTDDVYVFDTQTNSLSNTIAVSNTGESTLGIAVSNDGKTLYVGTGQTWSPYIAEIDIATQTAVGHIPHSEGPINTIATRPGSTSIYATAVTSNVVDVFTFLPEPDPTPTPTLDPVLASTGANIAPLGVAAALLVTIGVAILVALRRRSR